MSSGTGRRYAETPGGRPAWFGPRVAVAYCSYFAFLGLYLPYFPIWLQSRGIAEYQIGIILAVPMAVRVLTSGFLVALADTRFDRAVFTMAVYVISAILFSGAQTTRPFSVSAILTPPGIEELDRLLLLLLPCSNMVRTTLSICWTLAYFKMKTLRTYSCAA